MIKFGTSGWRGIIGEDFTFSNVRVAMQGIANYLTGPLPDWWWNILTYVRDETRALELASMFATTADTATETVAPFNISIVPG